MEAFSKGNNWFVGQNVKLADGKTLTLDVQAGNFKNGTNFIGTITLTRSGDEVAVTYAVNDDRLSELPDVDGYELGDQITVTELKNASYKVAATYTPVKNNGAKEMTAFNSGDTFKVPGDSFYIYIHFEAVYTTYELVEATAE